MESNTIGNEGHSSGRRLSYKHNTSVTSFEKVHEISRRTGENDCEHNIVSSVERLYVE